VLLIKARGLEAYYYLSLGLFFGPVGPCPETDAVVSEDLAAAGVGTKTEVKTGAIAAVAANTDRLLTGNVPAEDGVSKFADSSCRSP
jgi:hypothetical protein